MVTPATPITVPNRLTGPARRSRTSRTTTTQQLTYAGDARQVEQHRHDPGRRAAGDLQTALPLPARVRHRPAHRARAARARARALLAADEWSATSGYTIGVRPGLLGQRGADGVGVRDHRQRRRARRAAAGRSHAPTTDGTMQPTPAPGKRTRVVSATTARTVRLMLETVLGEGGTAPLARDPRLPGRRQDRHRAAVRPRLRLLPRLHHVVHRDRPGRQPAAGRGGHPAGAQARPSAAASRRPGVQGGHVLRAAVAADPADRHEAAQRCKLATTLTGSLASRVRTRPDRLAAAGARRAPAAERSPTVADQLGTVVLPRRRRTGRRPVVTGVDPRLARGAARRPLRRAARRTAHGADFAAARAARAARSPCLTDPAGAPQSAAAGLPVLVVADPRAVLGPLAAWVYGDPARDAARDRRDRHQRQDHHGLPARGRAAGRRARGPVWSARSRPASATRPLPSVRTTPEAPDLQALLAVMRERGVEAVAMEVSSHALALGRVDGTTFDVAVFTNLVRGPPGLPRRPGGLLRARRRRCSRRSAAAVGVVNVDDAYGERLAADGRAMPVVTVSPSGRDGADWRVENVERRPGGQHVPPRSVPAASSVDARHRAAGDFNVDNAALAVVALVQRGRRPGRRRGRASRACAGVPGRMERVETGARTVPRPRRLRAHPGRARAAADRRSRPDSPTAGRRRASSSAAAATATRQAAG